MKTKGLSRRDFLRTSGAVATGLAAGGAVLFGPDYAWAMSTKTLDGHTAETLLLMGRQLFPHDRLGTQYYAHVVEQIDTEAAQDPALRKLLADGIARLDTARGITWINLSDGARSSVLKGMEDSDFFNAVYTRTLNGLYGNPLVYRFFGFEGSSVEYGGYIDRGFDDIGWLPQG